MQSGKTGTIRHLCNIILPEIRFINDHESIMFLTSMRDSDLKEQNLRALENDNSRVFVMQMDSFKSSGLVEIKNNNVKLIIRDEDQYGCGKESTFDRGFFDNVRILTPNIPLLSVSATPFDVLDAKEKNLQVNVIHGLRHENYFGISEMLKQDMVIDLPNDYDHFKSNGDKTIISDEIKKSVLHLNQFEKGVGIIRCKNTLQAVNLKDQLKSLNEQDFEIFIIGCKNDMTDFPIKEGIRILSRKLRMQKKRVILIVIHALSAGKDMKDLKNHIKFVIETRRTQVANCVQGLPGRVCGYHQNREILIYANKDILEYYSDFENDPTIFNNEDWIDELFHHEKVKTLTSQTRFHTSQKEGLHTPINDSFELTIEDLFTKEGEQRLSFLNQNEYGILIKYFDRDVYERHVNVGGLRNRSIQLRISSRYKKYNTVFRAWNKVKGDNFKSLFNHKNRQAEYGILISNFPKNDKRNELGFCGIKVFKPGKTIFLNRLTVTTNHSMYKVDD